jgi:dCMP deaminase
MRPTKISWAVQLAQVCAQRSTCCRRQVGCVLLNDRFQVLSTGYNGVTAGLPHCNDVDPDTAVETFSPTAHYPNACRGASAPSGQMLDACEAIHAEQNALLQCRNVYEIHTCVVTASPCITCVKLLLNTSCDQIIFVDEYPHKEARGLWLKSGRAWIHYPHYA